jgi:hypothetical protein
MKAMQLIAQCTAINDSSLGLVLIMYNDGMMLWGTKDNASTTFNIPCCQHHSYRDPNVIYSPYPSQPGYSIQTVTGHARQDEGQCNSANNKPQNNEKTAGAITLSESIRQSKLFS